MAYRRIRRISGLHSVRGSSPRTRGSIASPDDQAPRAGSLLTWLGFALTSRSAPLVVAVAGLLGRGFQKRIQAEKRLLTRTLPGYTTYRQRRKNWRPVQTRAGHITLAV